MNQQNLLIGSYSIDFLAAEDLEIYVYGAQEYQPLSFTHLLSMCFFLAFHWKGFIGITSFAGKTVISNRTLTMLKVYISKNFQKRKKKGKKINNSVFIV